MVSKTKIMAKCPSCGETVLFEVRPKIGQFIDCPFCNDFLEVVGLEPVLLDWPDEEEDYYYDEDDFDEED